MRGTSVSRNPPQRVRASRVNRRRLGPANPNHPVLQHVPLDTLRCFNRNASTGCGRGHVGDLTRTCGSSVQAESVLDGVAERVLGMIGSGV